MGRGRALGWRLAHVRGPKGGDFRRAKVGETAGAVGANRAGLGVPVAMRKSPRARRQSRRARWEVGRGAPLPTPSPEGALGLRERRGVGGEPGCQGGGPAPSLTILPNQSGEIRLTANLLDTRRRFAPPTKGAGSEKGRSQRKRRYGREKYRRVSDSERIWGRRNGKKRNFLGGWRKRDADDEPCAQRARRGVR